MNPFSFSEPVTDPNMFIGRRAELDEMVHYLRSTIVIGETKSGKSSLLLRLHDELSSTPAQRFPITPIYINLKSPLFYSADTVYSHIFDRLTLFIQQKLQIVPRPYENSDAILRILDLLSQCSQVSATFRTILLIDDIDNYARGTERQTRLFQGLRQLIDGSPPEQHVTVMAASTYAFLSAEQIFASTLLSRLEPVIFLSALSPDDCATLVRKASSALPPDALTTQFCNLVYEATGGHPYVVQVMMSHIVKLVLAGGCALPDAFSRIRMSLASDFPVFTEWVQQMSIADLTYLQALAMRVPTDNWPLAQSSIDRLLGMGVIRVQGPTGRIPAPSCQVFFEWIRENSRRLVELSDRSLSKVYDVVSLATLLQSTLRSAIGNKQPANERQVQDHVQAILAAHQLSFRREGGDIVFKDRRFRPDFLIADFDLVIEVKLIKSTTSLSDFTEQLIIDSLAYSSKHLHVIFVCYDLTGLLSEEALFRRTDWPGARFVIVRHG